MSPLDQTMAADAAEAMKLTRKHFVVELDFSDNSVAHIEQVLQEAEFAFPGGKSPANIDQLTRVWGAYLGETIRRNFGGHWQQSAGEDTPRLVVNQTPVTPHEVIRQALMTGSTSEVPRLYDQLRR